MASRELFDEFIAKYLGNAHNLAKIYVNHQQDAEDVVAESIEKALRNIHSLNEPGLIKEWFNKIVINTSINHLKKRSRSTTAGKGMPVYRFDDFSQLYFEDLIDTLPPNERQIVHLRFCDKYELKEIAEALEINENTVKTRLYRALGRLRLEVADAGAAVRVRKEKSVATTATLAFFAALLSAACVLNLSPTLAQAAYEIPIIGDIVRVITFNRFDYSDRGYEAEIRVPEIKGLLDAELEEKLNSEFREYADELIRSFETSILEIEELGVQLDEDYGVPANMSIKADYTVKTDNDRVLAVDAYIYSDVNNYFIHQFCNIDKQTGTVITLAGLFKPGADYISPISGYIVSEMERQNEEEGGQFDVGDSAFASFSAIRPDHSFYISDDAKLVICFDKYEVAPGFVGSPEFIIPTDVINAILSSDLIV